MQFCTDEVHELLTGVHVFLEGSGEFGCRGYGVLLLDTSHRHTEVLALDYDGHTNRIEDFLNAVLDLCGEALLQLQSAGKAFHHAWDLAQSDDGAVGDVSHVGLAEEGQQMMFAEGVDFDVLHHDDLSVVFVEESAFEDFLRVLAVAVCQKVHRFGGAHRGFDEAFALRVFAHVGEDVFITTCEFVQLFICQVWIIVDGVAHLLLYVKIINAFVTDGCGVAVSGVDGHIVTEGQYFAFDHVNEEEHVAGWQVGASHAALEDEVAADDVAVGGIVEGDTAVAVAGGVEHLQALAAEADFVAFVQESVRSGHFVGHNAECGAVGIGFVVDGHAGIVAEERGVEFTHAPTVARDVVNVRMRVDNVSDGKLVGFYVLLQLRVFVRRAIARVHNYCLATLIVQYHRVYHDGVEMESPNRHSAVVTCQVFNEVC